MTLIRTSAFGSGGHLPVPQRSKLDAFLTVEGKDVDKWGARTTTRTARSHERPLKMLAKFSRELCPWATEAKWARRAFARVGFSQPPGSEQSAG